MQKLLQNILLTLTLINFNGYTKAFSADYNKSIITDPAISRRCNALIKKRNQKIEVKQKLVSLIVRNERLKKITPKNKKTVSKSLEINFTKLNNELKLAKLTIEYLEENIIRKGCPGISL